MAAKLPPNHNNIVISLHNFTSISHNRISMYEKNNHDIYSASSSKTVFCTGLSR